MYLPTRIFGVCRIGIPSIVLRRVIVSFGPRTPRVNGDNDVVEGIRCYTGAVAKQLSSLTGQLQERVTSRKRSE